ncbi:amidohydrolase family protein [Terrimonas pollutisoli]|uniref:amidohydrolase family protein n=1 Tax=Terrimonas pollutisoli TaxID=3034147 RepID=UPI0023EE0F70|nr:amidohydrolase family protein [Terrimonas sp. H1YJ31]
MKSLILLFAIFSLVSCVAQSPVDNKQREVVFKEVNVIPMDKNEVLKNRDVVVKDGVITAINPSGKSSYSKDAVVVDAKGKYLLPGLAEMHAHVPPVDDLAPMKDVVMLFALKGVTTIRGMLGHPRHLELRAKLQSGEIIGPRFITSGPSFNGNSVKTPEAASAMVREQKQAGYDFLKLHPGITKENFAAIAITAKEVNIPFAGHVSFDVGVWRAIDAGYATIDHLDGFVESLVPGIENMKAEETGLFGLFIADKVDEARIQKLTDSLRNHHIWVVPTQALAERWFHPIRDADALAKEEEMKYMDAGTIKNWITTKKNLLNNPNYNTATANRLIDVRRKLIAACNKNGVGLLLGSDAPQVFDVPGFSVHHELRYLVDAGLTPYEALKTGTVNVGKFLGRDNIGVIKVGAVAEMLLLNNNPLENIDHSKNIEGVMMGNLWMNKEYINAELKKLEKNK